MMDEITKQQAIELIKSLAEWAENGALPNYSTLYQDQDGFETFGQAIVEIAGQITD